MHTIYGKDLELEETDGGVITDVLVVAREVRYDDSGNAEDALLVSATNTTTSIIQQGMANDLLLAISLSRGPDTDE